MSSTIQDWHTKHARFTCKDSQTVLDKSGTDQEFYDGLNSVLLFMTGILHNCPTQALHMMMRCAKRVLPEEGFDPILLEGRAVAVDPDATPDQVTAQRMAVMRYRPDRKTEDYAYQEIVVNILQWRMSDYVVYNKELMRHFGRAYARMAQLLSDGAPNNEDGEQRVLAHLKEILPFEEWVIGFEREAYKKEPYADVEIRLAAGGLDG